MSEEEYKRLLQRAGAYTAKAERSEKEVVDKLHRWAREPISREEVAQIVEWLRHNHFIDEERYVRHFVNDKTEYLGKGPHMLRRELWQKGVSDEAIEAYLETIPHERWTELLARYLAPKVERYRQRARSSYDLGRRLRAAAYGRGYPSEIIEAVLETIDLSVEGGDEDEEGWSE